jgi:hypothetical protein
LPPRALRSSRCLRKASGRENAGLLSESKTLEGGPPFALIYKMWQVGMRTLLDRFARNQEKAFGFPFTSESMPTGVLHLGAG